MHNNCDQALPGKSAAVSPLPLMQLSIGFWSFKALASAYELDLFTCLSGIYGLTIEELAEMVGVAQPPVELLVAEAAARSRTAVTSGVSRPSWRRVVRCAPRAVGLDNEGDGPAVARWWRIDDGDEGAVGAHQLGRSVADVPAEHGAAALSFRAQRELPAPVAPDVER